MPGLAADVAAAVCLERVREAANPQAAILCSSQALTLPRPFQTLP